MKSNRLKNLANNMAKNRKTTTAIVLFAGLLIFNAMFLLSVVEDSVEYNAVHGPHIGKDLSEYTGVSNESSLASTIRSRVRRMVTSGRDTSRNIGTQTLSSSTTSNVGTVKVAASVSTQSAVVNTATPLYGFNNNNFGVAAGGGLTLYSQAELDKYFGELRDLGVSWLRWDIDWPTVQPNDPDTYNWTEMDRIANTAKNYGIKSLAIITYAPGWAESSTCPSGRLCPPQDISQFAKFAGVVANRYKGVVSAYEIWNEENYPTYWWPTPNAGVYADMLKLSYSEIKKNDPDALVLSGGLGAAEDSINGSISPVTFVKSLYAAGVQNYFDALALHPYSYPVSPTYSASWNSFQQMFQIRNIMVSAGDSSKKIWITEYGAPTGGPGTQREIDQLTFKYGSDYMSENSQNELIKTAVNEYSQNKNWIGAFFWYSLRDNGQNTNDPENFFGLIRNDWSKKDAFNSMKSIISTFN